MTAEHGHNFIREIAEAYRALENEEALLARVAMLEKQHVADGERVARLEERLIRRNEEINELHAKVRSVEAERDDAGFRLLESEDRLDAIRKAIGLSDIVAKAVAKREGEVREELKPKAEPELVIVPESATAVVQFPQEAAPGQEFGQVNSPEPSPSPIVESGQASEPLAASTGDASSQGSASTGDGPQSVGESAIDPTGGSGGTGGLSEPVPPVLPYAGKRYIEVEGYISRGDWREGGGTDESYDWRPDYLHSQAAS